MKKAVLVLFFIFSYALIRAQSTLSVKGDADKFYPVLFIDGNWSNNIPTELEIGRSDTHWGKQWGGSLMARFRFHSSFWGNGSGFIDMDLIQNKNGAADINVPFIAGYCEGSTYNLSRNFIVWLKGNTFYSYKSNSPQSPVVCDGVQHSLPFQEENGPLHNFKTIIDSYVNPYGVTNAGSIYCLGTNSNYMNGDLGLGTLDTKGYKLAVNGKVRAQEIKVENSNWPDFVFSKSYVLPKADEISAFINANGHLQGIPSAKEVQANGIDLGDMNARLLQKVEELTLLLLEQDKKIKAQDVLLKKIIDKIKD